MKKTVYSWVWTCQNFVQKIFAGSSQIVKFVKVFSLVNFLLYSRYYSSESIVSRSFSQSAHDAVVSIDLIWVVSGNNFTS